MRLRLREQVEAAFAAALSLPEEEWEAFLTRECGGDAALREEVRTLLRNYRAAGDFLGADDTKGWVSGAPSDSPAVIGRYRIVRLLGKGGMGLVYEAEQDRPRRIVALKVMRDGFTSPAALRRFEQESQVLGRLQHPGIAQIYEAGTADNGCGPQPYFAMELIRGVTLLQYVAAHQLGTRQRLELMSKICVAVHHAHQRGIIHRDLKPGNILVDEAGEPKVLDFGVACATDPQAHTTRQTDQGQIVGTLEYMSPEQVLADPLEIDIRSDIYSLGVILFELLAGQLPYHFGTYLHAAVQTIREKDPVRLGVIRRTYRGDIETIAAKALEKDKARRYSSAADFGMDIRRYLTDEPIVARPPSTLYQLRKFSRRHKPAVAGVAAVFAVLSAGILVSAREAVRAQLAGQAALRARDRAAAAERAATAERDRAANAERVATVDRNRAIAEQQRADTESAAAKAINDFLQNDLLAQASARSQARPGHKPDPDLKVRTVLDRAASRFESRFARQPLVEASIRQTIGITYKDLGLYANAQQHIERALKIRNRILGDTHPETLRSMSDLALVYRYEGQYPRAEELGVKVLQLRRRALGERHRETLESMGSLMEVLRSRGKYAQAESLGTKLLSLRSRVLGENHPDTLESINNLGLLYLYEGKYGLADPLFSKALEIQRRTWGENHPETMTGTNNLAILYYRQGKYSQAELLLEGLIERQRNILGEDHPSTLLTSHNLAMAYLRLGRYRQAEQLFQQTLQARRRVLGEEHPNTLSSMNSLVLSYLAQGKVLAARPMILNVLDVRRRVLGEEHPETLNSKHTLGLLYLHEENDSLAEPLLTRLLETQQRVLGREHPDALNTMRSLAHLYSAGGRFAQAEALAKKHLDARSQSLGPTHPVTLSALVLLGRIVLRQERYAEAESLLRRALKGYEETVSGEWERYEAKSMLGASLAAQGRFAEAEPLLLSGDRHLVGVRITIPWDNRSTLARSAERIARLYQDWGKSALSAHWQAELRLRQ